MRWARAAAILLILIACVRIASTYTRFSETADEPMHLTAGLQILTDRAYSIQLQNPPLPRLFIAFGPWLAGARYDRSPDPYAEATGKLYSTGEYERLLFRARAGALPFFVIAALATWFWARRELGELGALAALLLFTSQPVILGHAGLATLDISGTAGLAVSLLAFSRWLERPTTLRAAVLGTAFGFAVLMKLLCLAYVPAGCAALLLVALARDSSARSQWRAFATLPLAIPVTMLIVWAGYGFDYGTMFGGSTRVPAPMLLQGMKDLLSTNAQGFQSYAWGSASYAGWWWYFPFAVGLKTTLATLILTGLGFVVAMKNRAFQNGAAVSLALLAVAMPTHVNIGVRYVLPIYVPLSVAAAAAFLALLSHRAFIARWAGPVLLAWHSIAGIAAHPHYLAYFNETAGGDPSEYLIDSNLDWGQDVLELGRVLRAEKVSSVGIHLFGPAKPDELGFPPYNYLQPWTPASGWVAVSDHPYRMGLTEGQWWWLVGQPYRRVGRSIRLYHLP